MLKYILKTFIALFIVFLFAGTIYAAQNLRFHAITSEKSKGDVTHFIATGRTIDFLADPKLNAGTKDIHNKQIYTVIDGKRFTAGNGGVSPIWLRPQYGICLNSKCGPK